MATSIQQAKGFMVVGSRDSPDEHISLFDEHGRRAAVELSVELEDQGFLVAVYGFRGDGTAEVIR
jgi:hypothetical protein